ncbi:hypothetical protein [Streptomyces sp. NPDC050263]|uniref:hypothetical protein n=1 Tax=Streptomyces sp. NPDC050263 TaxID=3155037 RepID=UPI00343290CF
MRSPTRACGRRGAVWGASAAAAVVMGAAGLLTGCGGDGQGGDYVAIGAAGDPAPPGARTGDSADPTGAVRLVPLDGDSPDGKPDPGTTGTTANEAGNGTSRLTEPGSGSPQTSTGENGQGGEGDRGGEVGEGGRTTPNSPAPTPTAPLPTPSGGASAGPAALSLSEPVRADTDQRWCEDVTLAFHNSGGAAVGSGTVTFGTHIVDALGIDWATRESTAPLPTPIAAGARGERTWRVCVDAWRVPLGMHVETRDVSVRWE